MCLRELVVTNEWNVFLLVFIIVSAVTKAC